MEDPAIAVLQREGVDLPVSLSLETINFALLNNSKTDDSISRKGASRMGSRAIIRMSEDSRKSGKKCEKISRSWRLIRFRWTAFPTDLVTMNPTRVFSASPSPTITTASGWA